MICIHNGSHQVGLQALRSGRISAVRFHRKTPIPARYGHRRISNVLGHSSRAYAAYSNRLNVHVASMSQFNFLDTLIPAPVRIDLPVDPNGPVIRESAEIAEVLEHCGRDRSHYRIELHPHTDGLWMWATSYQISFQGGGYRVGPKWGKFAEDRAGALYHACEELRDRLHRLDPKSNTAVRSGLAWLDSLS